MLPGSSDLGRWLQGVRLLWCDEPDVSFGFFLSQRPSCGITNFPLSRRGKIIAQLDEKEGILFVDIGELLCCVAPLLAFPL